MTHDAQQKVYWESEHGHRGFEHPVVKFFSLQRIEQVAGRLDFKGIEKALDVGCGSGFSTYYMQEKVPHLFGVDRSQKMLSTHPLRGRNRLAMADVRHLPFPDRAFDLVYGWEILHHMEKPEEVIREMARVSRKYIVVAEPNRLNPAQFAFALADREHRWVLRYSLSYMKQLFQKAGVEPVEAWSGGWIFPNKTPIWLLPLLRRIPYKSFLGISHWVVGIKKNGEG